MTASKRERKDAQKTFFLYVFFHSIFTSIVDAFND